MTRSPGVALATSQAISPPDFAAAPNTAVQARPVQDVLAKLDESQRELATCPDKAVVGIAFAGAGKTTTAIAYAQLRPTAKILYLCLNKQNQLEAQQRFPSWVTAQTTHSVAFADVGRHYNSRLSFSIRPSQFAAEHNIYDMQMAAAAQATVNTFLNTADTQVHHGHATAALLKYGLDAARADEVVSHASRAWAAMHSLSQSSCSVTHDVYLKAWSLKRPSLSKYTHIIVDEAQDSNPVILDVLRRQDNTRLYIGDPHQSIYQFRGSVNAISQLAQDGARVIKMPRTWRFGQDIANPVNRLLRLLKDESTSIIGAGPSGAHAPNQPKSAFLSRTNAGLIEYAVAKRGKGIHWVGGIDKYAVDILLDAWHLKCGEIAKVRDPYMRSAAVKSWRQYVELAKVTKDGDANLLVKMVDEYKQAIPILVEQIKRHALPDAQAHKAAVSITTAHKSKGLEWDCVTLGDDFCKLADVLDKYVANGLSHEDDGQEINMVYVAMTRARKELSVPEPMQRFLWADYAKHERSVRDAALLGQGAQLEQLQQSQTQSMRG